MAECILGGSGALRIVSGSITVPTDSTEVSVNLDGVPRLLILMTKGTVASAAIPTEFLTDGAWHLVNVTSSYWGWVYFCSTSTGFKVKSYNTNVQSDWAYTAIM